MKKFTRSIARKVMTKNRNDFIVYDMISSIESNWVTDLGTLLCLGEEIKHSHVLLKRFVSEEMHVLNCSENDDHKSK